VATTGLCDRQSGRQGEEHRGQNIDNSWQNTLLDSGDSLATALIAEGIIEVSNEPGMKQW
jgi:hypothetical protein